MEIFSYVGILVYRDSYHKGKQTSRVARGVNRGFHGA
jgi:hypothetical protein